MRLLHFKVAIILLCTPLFVVLLKISRAAEELYFLEVIML